MIYLGAVRVKISIAEMLGGGSARGQMYLDQGTIFLIL